MSLASPHTIRLRVTRLERIATDAVKVYLEALDGQPVSYEPGQYLTFLIRLNEKEFRRSYSLVSVPGLDDSMAIVVKRQANGDVSRFVYDHLQAGEVLSSLPPAGRFTLTSNAFEPHVIYFLAAGSGIIPVFALLKEALYHRPALHHHLIYQSHDEAGTILLAELEELQQLFPHHFTFHLLLSDPADRHIIPQRLNNNLLEQLVKGKSSPHDLSVFYLCGPESFMRMAAFVLRYLGFADQQIRKENFVIRSVPAPPLLSDTTPKNVTVHWQQQTYHFQVSYPASILQAALAQHIHLPYSCRGGKCSACVVRCRSGLIKMSLNEVLTPQDLEEGYRLTCVGYAETDLVLEL